MVASSTSKATWPRGWTSARRQEWADLGLDVDHARRFQHWGWAPKAALAAVSVLTAEERSRLDQEGLSVPPGRDVRVLLILRDYGVTSFSAEWDEAAVKVLADAAVAAEVAARLNPMNEPALAVLAALHEVGTDVPLDVSLARHADDGCSCADERFQRFLGIGPVVGSGDVGLISMNDDDDQTLEIRTGVHLSDRVDHGPWLRLPDLASACWYLRQQSESPVSAVSGELQTALQCAEAMGRLNPDQVEIQVNDLDFSWTGTSLWPNEIPGDFVITESQWDGDDSSPMNSGTHTTRLALFRGVYYVGGDEMPWEGVGPFSSDEEAIAWFDVTWGDAAMDDGSDGDETDEVADD